MAERPKDLLVPLILIGVGLLIYVAAGFLFAGPEGAVATVVGLLVLTAVQVVLGLIALHVTAAIMGIDFGPLSLGLLKLAAIFIFPDAVSALIPVAGLDWLVSLGLYLGLLAWLFDLEPLELIVCVVVIFLVRLLAMFVLAGAVIAAFG